MIASLCIKKVNSLCEIYQLTISLHRVPVPFLQEKWQFQKFSKCQQLLLGLRTMPHITQPPTQFLFQQEPMMLSLICTSTQGCNIILAFHYSKLPSWHCQLTQGTGTRASLRLTLLEQQHFTTYQCCATDTWSQNNLLVVTKLKQRMKALIAG